MAAAAAGDGAPHPRERRIDEGEPYTYQAFVECYGDEAEERWHAAPHADYAGDDTAGGATDASGVEAVEGVYAAGGAPEDPTSAMPTVAERALMDQIAAKVAARLHTVQGNFDYALRKVEQELAAAGYSGEFQASGHNHQPFYLRAVTHALQLQRKAGVTPTASPRPGHRATGSGGGTDDTGGTPPHSASAMMAERRGSTQNGAAAAAALDPDGPSRHGTTASGNPIAHLPARRDSEGACDPFGGGMGDAAGGAAAVLEAQRAERQKKWDAMDNAQRLLHSLQANAGAERLNEQDAQKAEREYLQAGGRADQLRKEQWMHGRRRAVPKFVGNRVRRRTARRQQRRREQVVEAHAAAVGSEAALVLTVVRIQCWWRGCAVRLLRWRLRQKGVIFSWHDRRAYQIVTTTFRLRSRVEWDMPAAARSLPVGPYGAWKASGGDSSPTRVSWRKVLWFYAVRGGYRPSGCRGFGILILFVVVMCPTMTMMYLLPGLIALGIKLWFTVDHGSLTLDQVNVWVLTFIGCVALLLAVLFISLAVLQENFGRKLDLVFSVVAAKHRTIITLQQAQSLRGHDLSVTKRAFYTDLPLLTIHGLHAIMGWATVFALDPVLGGINFGYPCIMLILQVLYDRLVISQKRIMGAVSARQGATYRRSLRTVADEAQVSGLPRQQQPRRYVEPAYRERHYNIAMNKSLNRMTRSFSRLHSLVIATALMFTLAVAVFYFYTGAQRMVRRSTPSVRMLPHQFVICAAYSLFTQASIKLCFRRFAAFFIARPAVHRVFRIGHHFRDMVEDSVFVERHCEMFAKTQRLKASREQPPSRELFCAVAFVWLLLLLWVFVFAWGGVQLECGERRVRCIQMRNDGALGGAGGGERMMPMPITMPYEFKMFEGCTPMRPVAWTLRICARYIIQQSHRLGYHDPWRLGVNDTFSAQVWYATWMGKLRGVQKRFQVRINSEELIATGQATLAACPTIDLVDAPFMDLYGLNDTEHFPQLREGSLRGEFFNTVNQLFYMVPDEDGQPYQGCHTERSVPQDACEPRSFVTKKGYSRALQECWCAQGKQDGRREGPRPIRMSGTDLPCECSSMGWFPPDERARCAISAADAVLEPEQHLLDPE